MLSKNVVVILITGLLSSLSAVATERGGYGVGNGGDGLDLASAGALRDVVIPIPGEIGDRGVLEVIGTPGAGQPNTFRVRFSEADSLGNLKKGGSVGKRVISGEVNVSMALSPGTYQLVYGLSSTLVQIGVNQKTVVELQKIQLQPSPRPVHARLTADYTNPAMQYPILQELFSGWDSKLNILCKGATGLENALACAGYAAEDYRKLSNSVVQFNSNGTVEIWDLLANCWKFAPIGESSLDPGQFVSVLPGVYAITFTDTQTGQSKTVRGIDVR